MAHITNQVYEWPKGTEFYDEELGIHLVVERQSFRLYRKKRAQMLIYTLRSESGKAHQRSQNKMLEQINNGTLHLIKKA